MSIVLVEEGHVVHAVAMYNEEYWLAWGDLPSGYEDPWTIGDTPPRSDSQTVTESVVKGVDDGSDQLTQTTLLALMNTTDKAIIEQNTTLYDEGVDYNILAGGVVDWLGAPGVQPVSTTSYTVKYRYNTDDFNTLAQEIGRRTTNQKAYVVEDQFGAITANGSKWTIVTGAQTEVTEITCVTNVQAAGTVDLDSRIVITAENGYANNIIIVFVDDPAITAGNEVATFDVPTNTLTVTIDDGNSNEGQICNALVTDPHIDTAVPDSSATVWTLGVGTDTGTITGGTGYAGGESFKFWDTNGLGYYVWVTSGGIGSDPGHVNMIAVPVPLLITDDASGVATKIALVLNALAQFVVPAPAAEVITMTAVAAKVQQDAVDVDMLVSINVPTQGTVFPTRNLYIEFKFLSEEAFDKDIYQIALFVNTIRNVGVPPNQEYLIPGEILDAGQMYMVESIEPFPRSAGKREIFDFVIVY